MKGAVEEILRWANPLHYFRRTALADTEIRGVPIARGQKVAMWYTSANRDESVFLEPDRFDVRRDPNPHLAFGVGQHFCLGVHLARLEGSITQYRDMEGSLKSTLMSARTRFAS